MDNEEKKDLLKLFILFLKKSKMIKLCDFKFNLFKNDPFIPIECLIEGKIERIHIHGIIISITDNLHSMYRTLSIEYPSRLFEPLSECGDIDDDDDDNAIYADIEMYDIKIVYCIILYNYFLYHLYKIKKIDKIKLHHINNIKLLTQIIKKESYEEKWMD